MIICFSLSVFRYLFFIIRFYYTFLIICSFVIRYWVIRYWVIRYLFPIILWYILFVSLYSLIILFILHFSFLNYQFFKIIKRPSQTCMPQHKVTPIIFMKFLHLFLSIFESKIRNSKYGKKLRFTKNACVRASIVLFYLFDY